LELFFRANLGLGGLGVGSAVPVGVPLPWPTATAPTGWIKCNGASFSLTAYPNLALVYPTGVLPDLRGEFIRGFDDGRGVDIARTLLSPQGATTIRSAALDYYGRDSAYSDAISGTAFSDHDFVSKTQPDNAMSPVNGPLDLVMKDNGMQCTQLNTRIDDYSVWFSVRPRNVALNYIVRAA